MGMRTLKLLWEAMGPGVLVAVLALGAFAFQALQR